MVFKNYAISGGTIAENPPHSKSGNARHSVSATLDQMYAQYPDADYIVLEGGTNDADLLGNALEDRAGTRLGSFTPDDYSGNYEKETFMRILVRQRTTLSNRGSGSAVSSIIIS